MYFPPKPEIRFIVIVGDFVSFAREGANSERKKERKERKENLQAHRKSLTKEGQTTLCFGLPPGK